MSGAGEWYEYEDDDGVSWDEPVRATADEFVEVIRQFVTHFREKHQLDIPRGRVRFHRRGDYATVTLKNQVPQSVFYGVGAGRANGGGSACYLLPHLSWWQSCFLTVMLSSGMLWDPKCAHDRRHWDTLSPALRAEEPALDFCTKHPLVRPKQDTPGTISYRNVIRDELRSRFIPDLQLLSLSLFGRVGVTEEHRNTREYARYDDQVTQSAASCKATIQRVLDIPKIQRLVDLGVLMPVADRLEPLPDGVVRLLHHLDNGLANYVHVYPDAAPEGLIRATVSLTNKSWPGAPDAGRHVAEAARIRVPGRITMRRVRKASSIERLDLEGTPEAVVQVARYMRATVKLPHGLSIPT